MLVTNPVASKIYLCALSDDYSSITICRNIESPELSHPIDCLYFADDVIVVTAGGGGGGGSHMKQTGVLVVWLRGVNFGFWSRLGCSGLRANIKCHQGLV